MEKVIFDRELHEECGVFGIYGVPDAASLTYYGLHALQHRGQEGAGIVTVDDRGTFRRIKGGGLVTEVFNEEKLATLKGSMAIGHVRYTTAGGGGVENIQPFLFRHNTGDCAMAHNGNIVNSALLREYLENRGSLFQSTSDSEILAHLIKKESRLHDRPRIYAIIDAQALEEAKKPSVEKPKPRRGRPPKVKKDETAPAEEKAQGALQRLAELVETQRGFIRGPAVQQTVQPSSKVALSMNS